MTEFADAIQDETIETPPTSEPMARETYEESIEVTLTEEQRDEKRKRLECVDREIIRLEEEKKAAAKVFTNQLKPLQAERESILGVLDSGTEKQLVECYEHFEERLGKVEIRRVDTDEVVEERAMTAAEREDLAEERQGDLFDGGGSEPPPADLTDPADPVTPDNFEPTAEALAQAAEDEGRVVKTNSKEAKAKKAKRAAAAAEGSDAE